jgi:hypothetical protein
VKSGGSGRSGGSDEGRTPVPSGLLGSFDGSPPSVTIDGPAGACVSRCIVVVPTYNEAENLDRLIPAVLAQDGR